MEAQLSEGIRNERDAEIDAMIAAFKHDVDCSLLRENLKLTVEEQLIQLMQHQRFFEELQAAGRRMREQAHLQFNALSAAQAHEEIED